ncbi:MAG TPA: ATPase, partial [Ruminococcaceae bacterium]|nr:ATPase [Oscillospiraceae bacterium]
TLTLARLFHGFNCRGKGSVFQLKLFSNPYSLLAFFAGAGLLALVLLVPFMKPLFLVTSLSGRHLLQIVLLAFAPTLVIQLYKVIRERTAG